jgi:hypothetical protein
MKTLKFLSFAVIAGLAFSIFLTSCESNPEVKPQQDLLPKTFSVAIPTAISSIDNSTGGRINGRMKGDSIKGNDIYRHLGTFIAIGKGSAKLVEAFIEGIRKYHIDRIMTLTFKSDDDNRTKNLTVLSNVEYEGVTWDYQLTITDADSENNADGGKALEIFWNNSTPIKGIAIIKPYNCDRPKNEKAPDAMYRVNYSEEATAQYDSHMEVLISGLPVASPLDEPFSVDNLHMYVGKKGDVVDVYGNSDHPNAVLFTGDPGMNWAFVASGNHTKDIGVAEVGLPPNSIDTHDRSVLLKDYSIKNVFTNGITAVWPGVNQDLLAAYLSETAAPGYFDKDGFISGGVTPGSDWDVLATRLDDLGPYNPKETASLKVTFK